MWSWPQFITFLVVHIRHSGGVCSCRTGAYRSKLGIFVMTSIYAQPEVETKKTLMQSKLVLKICLWNKTQNSFSFLIVLNTFFQNIQYASYGVNRYSCHYWSHDYLTTLKKNCLAVYNTNLVRSARSFPRPTVPLLPLKLL